MWRGAPHRTRHALGHNHSMDVLKTFGLFVLTALAEIVGCYLPYLWLKQGHTVWLLVPAAAALALRRVAFAAPGRCGARLCGLWWRVHRRGHHVALDRRSRGTDGDRLGRCKRESARDGHHPVRFARGRVTVLGSSVAKMPPELAAATDGAIGYLRRPTLAVWRHARPASAATLNAAPAKNVNEAPNRSHSQPATPLATSRATPLTRLKNP